MTHPNGEILPWQYEYSDTPKDKLKYEMRLKRYIINEQNKRKVK